MSPIRLYHFKSKDGQLNFGDDLSPIVVEHVTQRPVIWAHPTRCDLAAIGSIVQRLTRHTRKRWITRLGRKVTIWGSGLIEAGLDPKARWFDCLAVRGPRTREDLQLSRNVPMGDPGLLFNRLTTAPGIKTNRWGIVPHYNDLNDARVHDLVAATPNATLISVRDDPMQVIKAISQCERIASSSLHGLVAADSFRIPSIRVSFGDRIYGGDYKFDDYARGIGRAGIDAVTLPPSNSLDDIAMSQFDGGHFGGLRDIEELLEAVLHDRYGR